MKTEQIIKEELEDIREDRLRTFRKLVRNKLIDIGKLQQEIQRLQTVLKQHQSELKEMKHEEFEIDLGQ